VNLGIERAFMGRDVSHNSIIHTTLFLKEYMIYDPQLNSRGKRRITILPSKE
jgi:hypothetical protein